MLLDERWQEVNAFGERQLVQQDLPENMTIELQVEGLYAQFQDQHPTRAKANSLFEDYDENNEVSAPAIDTDPSETLEQADAAKKVRPQIYLMSSGEINPFTLLVGYNDESPVYYQLKATFDGEVTLEGPLKQTFRFSLDNKQ